MSSEHLPEDNTLNQANLVVNYGNALVRGEAAILMYRLWQHIATHDSLTGVYNRLGIMTEIEERIETGEAVGILLIDLDKFKAINDNLGHRQGDNLLEDLGAYLSENFKRKGEIVAFHNRQNEIEDIEGSEEAPVGRIGGDEFIILVDLNRGGDADVDDEKRAESLEGQLASSVEYAIGLLDKFVNERPEDQKDQGFNYSIGAAFCNPQESDLPTEEQVSKTLSEADDKMYANKKSKGQSR